MKLKKIKITPKRKDLAKFANIIAKIYWNKPMFFDSDSDIKIRRALKNLIGKKFKGEK